MLALIVVSTFVSLALPAGILLYSKLSEGDSFRSRLAKLMPREDAPVTLMHTPKKWQFILAELGRKLRVTPAALHDYLELTTAAGFRTEGVYVFLGSKLLLAALLPAGYLLFFAVPRGEVGSPLFLLTTVILAISGYLLPTLWLGRRAALRKDEIFHSLPDVLDLLTVCVEAGLSMDAALIRTAENFQYKNDPLIKELNMVTLEISAGKPRGEALKGLAERTMLDDIKAFVTMVVQTERFGTGLGKTLRTYSDSLRIKRRQIAEEKAAKTAIKMLFPLTFCVFPALMVVMLAPAFFQIFAIFKH